MRENIKKIVACPKCKRNLVIQEKKLICRKCKKIYKIEEDIPVFF